MQDIALIALAVVLFALAVLLMKGCERIIGNEDAVEEATGAEADAAPATEVAA